MAKWRPLIADSSAWNLLQHIKRELAAWAPPALLPEQFVEAVQRDAKSYVHEAVTQGLGRTRRPRVLLVDPPEPEVIAEIRREEARSDQRLRERLRRQRNAQRRFRFHRKTRQPAPLTDADLAAWKPARAESAASRAAG
jgi:hypothetical protein